MNKLLEYARYQLEKHNMDPNLADYLYKYLDNKDEYIDKVKELINGAPIQYIIGNVNFYGLELMVNNKVLIPRFETEQLVFKLINRIKNKSNLHLLDIGTGSGCIAITIKNKIDNIKVDAVDISDEAIDLTKQNAKANNSDINIFKSDIFENVFAKYDVIISNPPYLKEDEEVMDIVKNNEPHLALYAPNNGLFFYEEILKNALSYLKEDYLIAFEIGYDEKEDIISLIRKHLPNSLYECEKDLQGYDRFIFIKSKNFD